MVNSVTGYLSAPLYSGAATVTPGYGYERDGDKSAEENARCNLLALETRLTQQTLEFFLQTFKQDQDEEPGVSFAFEVALMSDSPPVAAGAKAFIDQFASIPNDRLTFVPIRMPAKYGFVDFPYVVCVCVDPINRRIEYYDPWGCKKSGSERIDYLKAVVQRQLGDLDWVSQTHTQQVRIGCDDGRLVLAYIVERLRGKSIEDIRASSRSDLLDVLGCFTDEASFLAGCSVLGSLLKG